MVQDLINFFFPKVCVNCGLYFNTYLCNDCRAKLQTYLPESYLTRNISPQWSIESELKSQTALEKVFYFYKYDALIHKLIIKYKYGFAFELSGIIAELILNSNEYNQICDRFDVITYAPSSKQRLNWRGFNHTKRIAEQIATSLNIPYCETIVKVRNTKAQIELKREKRLENLTNSIVIQENLPIDLSNKNILIIDDILTTGATLEECALAIKLKYPDCKVFGMCLARGEG